MKPVFTRIFCVIVIVAWMVRCTASAQTATAPSVGDGTSGNPYQIATLENLYWISQNSGTWSSSYFIQTVDINASASSGWSGGAGLPPIGNGSGSFNGNYNGQNHTITGLYVYSLTNYVGLFGLSNATIKNIGLINATITGSNIVGGLVGGNGGSISNCYITGSVTGSSGNIVGGLVGSNYYLIDSCYSNASVTGNNTIGGLVGESQNNFWHIKNSYATGSVHGSSSVGGLIAYVHNNNSVINCYATGAVTGSSFVGGLIGKTDGTATISNSFWDIQTTGQSSSAGGGTGDSTSAMKTTSTFTSAGWSFTSAWGMIGLINNGYPYLRGVTPTSSLPVSLVNLSLWLRADINVTSTSNAVSVWGDQSGNGNDASQSTGSYQPVLQTNQINGKPVIHFNGSSTLVLPTASTLGIQNADYECFIVARSSSPAIQFLFSGNSTSNYEFHLNFEPYGSAGGRFIPNPSIGLNEGTSNVYTDGLPHVFNMQAASSGGVIRVDGVNGATSASDCRSSDAGALSLGVRSGGAFYLNGDIAEILIYKTVITTTARDSVEHYLASRYGISSGTLPVELVSVAASVKNNSVEVKWKTATEVNNYGFEIERRNIDDGQLRMDNWKKTGFVEGNGTTNAPKQYSFLDNGISTGKYSYRLKQIDRDGKFTYTQTVEVTVGRAPSVFALEQNYPNPFNPSTTIGFTLQVSGPVSLKVYDAIGREVAALVNENLESGVYHQRIFDASHLSSGIYYVRLISNGRTQIRKLVLMK